MNHSLIIPIFNEEKTLHKLLQALETLDKDIEIIIINDGSTDGTYKILNKINSFKVVNNNRNLGKGASIIIGEKIATTKNIILMDGDLEIDMNCIPKVIEAYNFKKNYVIVGTRWNNNSSSIYNVNTFGNFLINYLFNTLYKTHLKDVLCCVKMIDRDLLNSLNLQSKTFSIEAELMSKLALKKTKFLELNVVYHRRKKNEGKKLNISDGWGIIWSIIKIRLKSINFNYASASIFK